MATDTQFELAPNLPYVKLNANEKLLHVFNRSIHRTIGLSTIVSFPKSEPVLWENDSIAAVLLIHGHLSHKNAIYQPMLADVLSTMGFLVLRFDFRGQGDSEDSYDPTSGRLLDQDVEDLTTMIDLLGNSRFIDLVAENLRSTKDPRRLSLIAMIAHSRGTLAMYEYVLSQLQRCNCPCHLLVNCSGRYCASGYYDKINRAYPDWAKNAGFKAKTFRHGQMIDQWIPRDEIDRTATAEGANFAPLKSKAVHLLYYGDCDTIVPLPEAYHYKRLFGRNAILSFIQGADHNFYGLEDDPNARGLPLKRGKVNYSFELVAHMLVFFAVLKGFKGHGKPS